MIKVLFVCLGNICRSPMAELIMKDLINKNGLNNKIYIDSAGTSDEEEGNPVYFLAKNKLEDNGIETWGKFARKMSYLDYDKFDYIIGMERKNIIDILQIIGTDPKNKVYRLMDFTAIPRDIDDPWYTRDFDKAYGEIKEGCQELLKYLAQKI